MKRDIREHSREGEENAKSYTVGGYQLFVAKVMEQGIEHACRSRGCLSAIGFGRQERGETGGLNEPGPQRIRDRNGGHERRRKFARSVFVFLVFVILSGVVVREASNNGVERPLRHQNVCRV